MKKITFLIFLLLISNFLQAEEIKLSCNVKFVRTNIPSGEITNSNLKLIYEITELSNGTIFMSSSSYGFAPSVSTNKGADIISIDNFSNQNKWHIRNLTNTKFDATIDKEVLIDRNTGLIHISSTFTFTSKIGIQETIGDGVCEKVNLMKKKF